MRKITAMTKLSRLFVTLSLLAGLFTPFANITVTKAALQPANQPALSTLTNSSNNTAPILLIYNDSNINNPFGHFLGEIMQTEGFVSYDTAQLISVTATTLANYDSVVLAQTSLTAAQVSMFSQYVQGGGNLIAMRPDNQMAPIFGLGTANGTMANGYMAIQNNTSYGQGFPADSLQLHTTADLYNNPTAQVIALLYSDANTSTSFPAITVNNFGSGKAVAFTYDLATSVVYIRQGNLNQTNVDADGDGVIRIVDMYYNWIDLNKTLLPQADLQQRLFTQVLNQINTSKKPLPHFWYFPDSKNSVVVLTSDAHANPDSYFSTVISSMSKYNATTTFYLSQASQPAPSNVNSWEGQGFTFSTHPYEVSNPLDVGYDNVDSWFDTTYGPRTSRTVRVHRLQWQGWVDGGKIGEARGYNMDYTYYRYGTWLKKTDGTWARGYVTGSGMPMKLIDQSGNVLNYFGQYTEIADDQMLYAGPENLSNTDGYFYTKQAIDASQNGDYQPIVFQMHVDYYGGVQDWAENSISYTRSLGIPIYNGDTWLGFTENRYNSTLTNLGWSNNQLSFSASIPTTQTGQTIMVPAQSSTGNLSSISVNGTNTNYNVRSIYGQNFAFLTLAGGVTNITATFTPDTTPPVLSNQLVVPSTNQVQISWTTNKVATTQVDYGLTNQLGSTASTTGYTTNHAVTISGLNSGTTYFYKLTSTDQVGNSASSAVATFNTPTTQQTQNSFAQFSAGTFTNSAATSYAAGEVKLLSPLEDTFATTAVDSSKWNSGTWATGGSSTISNGVLTVGGAYINSKTSLSPAGHTLTAYIKFTPGVANQHFGFSPDLNSSWFIFSVPGFDTSSLYARTNYGSVQSDQKLGTVDLTQYHTLQIQFGSSTVNYYVDGTLMASQNVTFSGSMPVWFSSSSTSGPVLADWVRFDSYPTNGSFTSLPFDAGNAVNWAGLSWNGSLNGGGLQIQTRTSGDLVNWSGWSLANSSNFQSITSPTGRYLQYQLSLSTTNSATSPQLTSLSIGYNPVTVNQVVVTPTNTSVGKGQSIQFKATGYDAANNPLPGLVINWSVVNGGGNIDQTGVFTGTTIGTFTNTIQASSGGKTGFATVTVGNPGPTISSVSPISLVNTTNTTITITGTNFIATPTVQLGTQLLNSVTLTGTTNLSAVVPAGFAPGVYNLKITNPDSQSVTLSGAITVVQPAPTITSVSPNQGSTSINIPITITGTNFVNGASVLLGSNTLSSIIVVSATQLTAVVPAGIAQGVYNLTVTNTDGQSSTLSNAYTVSAPSPAPTINKVTPSIVSNTIANNITVTGANFATPISVTLSGTVVSNVNLVNTNTLNFTLPSGYATGTYNLSVINPDGQSSTVTGALSVVNQAVIQSTQSDFAAGTFTNTFATNRLDGEVKLKAGLEDYFEPATLDINQWISNTWTTGGSVSQASGIATISGAYLRSLNQLPMSSLQGRISFNSNSANQHFGFSPDLGSSWILFSIPSYDINHIYARTNIAGVYAETQLSTSLNTFHNFVITIGSGTIQYYVDGTLVATHTANVTGSNYVWLSASSTNPLVADSVVAGTYPSTGIFVSTPLDAGQLVNWSALNWQAQAISGTVTIEARSSLDAATWSAWSTATSTSGNVNLSLPAGRYLQYRLTLNTSASSQSPEVQAVAGVYGNYSPGPLARIVVSPGSSSLVAGATQQFTAQGYDSNNFVISGLSFSWSVNSGGSINSSGLYTAGSTAGSYLNSVIATSGTVTGSASVTVTAAPPTISSISPSSGFSAAPNTITVNGSNLKAVPSVLLGTTSLTNVTIISSSQLTATVPAGMATGVYTLTLTNPDTQQATLANAYTVTLAPAPSLTTVSPSSADNVVTRTITITGANFVTSPQVQLGSTKLSGVQVISSTQLTALVGTNFATGVYTVTVTNPDGQIKSLANAYTVTSPPALTQSSLSDFTAGTLVSTTLTTNNSTPSTSINLTPVLQDGFDSPVVNASLWVTGTWTKGGTALQNGSIASVTGGYYKSKSVFTQTVAEGWVKFSSTAGSYQNFGWATDLNSAGGPWALFGIPGYDSKAVYARTNIKGGGGETKIPSIAFDTYYDLKIVVGATNIQYYVNGLLVATHNVSTSTALNLYLSSPSVSGTLQADWLRVDKFATTGTFTSSILDAGSQVKAWGNDSWNGSVPAGSTLTVQTQSSVDGVTWSSWSSLNSVSGSSITSPVGRYIRYRFNFSSDSTSTLSPTITSTSLTYTLT